MKLIAAHLPQAASLPLRSTTPAVLVIHTTGRSLTGHAIDSAGPAWPEVEEAAVAWYRTSGTPDFGGYLIGPSGAVYKLADNDRRTRHAAALDHRYTSGDRTGWRDWARIDGTWRRHGRDPVRVWDWWDARWPDVVSPADLAAGPHPNDGIGIDLLPTMAGAYTAEQIAALRELVAGLCQAHGIFRDRLHVLGHEDVDPCGRGAVLRGGQIIGIPWDPSPALHWDALGLEAP